MSSREWKVGRTLLRFESPDLLHATLRGGWSKEDAIRIVEIYRELSSVRPFFVVGDMKEAELLEPEVGRYISEQVRPEWLLATVYYGTRLAHKAAIMGVLLSAQMAEHADEEAMGTLHFVSTRQEALERVEQLRARLEVPAVRAIPAPAE